MMGEVSLDNKIGRGPLPTMAYGFSHMDASTVCGYNTLYGSRLLKYNGEPISLHH